MRPLDKDPAVEAAKEFWKDILYKDGVLDEEQLWKEMTDFHHLIREVPKVYCAITGDKLSKLNYDAPVVIEAFEDYLTKCVDEALEERIKNPEAFEDAMDDLKRVIHEQIRDEGCWFIAQYATEAYLQERLRDLHRAADKILAAVGGHGAKTQTA